MSYLVKKVPMEKESNISLGGTIILLALFAQNLIVEQRYSTVRNGHKTKWKQANGNYWDQAVFWMDT